MCARDLRDNQPKPVNRKRIHLLIRGPCPACPFELRHDRSRHIARSNLGDLDHTNLWRALHPPSATLQSVPSAPRSLSAARNPLPSRRRFPSRSPISPRPRPPVCLDFGLSLSPVSEF